MGWLPAMKTLAQQLQTDPRRAEEVRIGKMFSLQPCIIGILYTLELFSLSNLFFS